MLFWTLNDTFFFPCFVRADKVFISQHFYCKTVSFTVLDVECLREKTPSAASRRCTETSRTPSINKELYLSTGFNTTRGFLFKIQPYKLHVPSWESKVNDLFSKKEEKKKEVYRSFSVKLWAKPESKLWLALRVDPCKTDKCMLHLYRCVLSIPRIVFLESMCIVKRILFFFVCLFFTLIPFLWVSLSVYHHSLWHVLQKTGEYFLPGTVVYCESLFSALLMKADTGTKLVSVWSWSHNKSLLNYLYFLRGGRRDEKGYIF